MLGRLARKLATAVRLIASGQVDLLRYDLWNKWKGVDFEYVSVEDLGLSPENAHFHSSSGGPTLARVFKTIDIPPGSVGLDLGSGKGGAALTLSGLGFTEVLGVDLSGELIKIAERNATRLDRRNVRFIQSDAATFNDYDRVSHVYMYNPFPCAVMTKVVARLAESLRRAPRPMVLVYRNPLCHETIATSGLFEAGPELRPDQHVWRVYRARTRSRAI